MNFNFVAAMGGCFDCPQSLDRLEAEFKPVLAELDIWKGASAKHNTRMKVASHKNTPD